LRGSIQKSARPSSGRSATATPLAFPRRLDRYRADAEIDDLAAQRVI